MEKTKDQTPAEALKMTGDWKEQSRKLKFRYALLTDKDLKFEMGKENELLKRIEIRLDKKREEVIRIIKRFQP